MSYDPNNVFAKILRGELPKFQVYEDARTLAFMDVMPQAEGHTLIIPKLAASQDILDVPVEDLEAVIATTQKVARAVKTAMDAPGVMVLQLSGAPAGQTVFHLHFHVIPRFHGLELKFHARSMEAPEKLKANADKIKAALAA
ncbi:MAG: HIT family protein [Alphaproteobacteria bacterium]|nr:HIT family protein [Alphaproteobacteria bacterium]